MDGTATKYLIDGSTVIAQQTGSDILWFLYESDGNRVGFTYNGTAYYYTKNAQGDVTGIVDGAGNTVVEYRYDAWGKLLSTTGSLASTIGKANPFLYRGYYYDSETGLYYLNSRYYDPQTGRFISEDGQLNPDTGLPGNNLFAYCNNNPITMVDNEGNRMLVQPGIETPQEQAMAAKYTSALDQHTSIAKKSNNRPRSLPKKGKPNSKDSLYGKDGKLKQEREYGPDGNASRDTDYSHGGVGHTFPHYHDWDWTKDPVNGERGDAYTLLGIAYMTVGVIILAAIVIDDATVVGTADDVLAAPVAGLVSKGAMMALA